MESPAWGIRRPAIWPMRRKQVDGRGIIRSSARNRRLKRRDRSPISPTEDFAMLHIHRISPTEALQVLTRAQDLQEATIYRVDYHPPKR